MRLFLEDEGALDLKLPYEELATKVADAVLDYGSEGGWYVLQVRHLRSYADHLCESLRSKTAEEADIEEMKDRNVH